MPIRLDALYGPLTILGRFSVAIPTLAHSVMFCFCSVLICVEIPGLLGVKFNLNFEAIGLNFMSNIIGYVAYTFCLGGLKSHQILTLRC
jgi:hypothetical protein